MQYKINVDVSNIIHKLWNEYDGDLSQKQWIQRNKKAIMQIFKNILDDIDIKHKKDMQIKQNLKEKEIHVFFVWQEDENIHTWSHNVKKEVVKVCNNLCQKRLWSH